MTWSRGLDYLQWCVAVAVLVLFSLGRGAHGVFIAILLTVPFLRVVFNRSYRDRIRATFKSQISALKAYPEGKTPWPHAFWLMGFPAMVFWLVNGISISSYDNFGTLLTASSIVREGNLELSEFITPETCTKGVGYYATCNHSGVRTTYPLGMVLPLVGTNALARILGADLMNGDVQWRLSKWTASGLGALCVILFFFIARHWTSFPAAMIVTYLLIVGSTFTTIISQGPWSHDGVVLGALAILFFEIAGKKKATRQSLLYGFLLAWMATSRVNAAVIILPLGLFILYRRGFWFAALTAIAAVLCFSPVAAYYQFAYHNWLGPQMTMGVGHGISTHPLSALAGVLFSPAHGLFIYQPWLVLLLLYTTPVVRHSNRIPKPALFVFMVGSLLQLIVVCLWPIWWGGTWGSRLLSEIIPFLAFLVLAPVSWLVQYSRALAKPVVAGLMTLSFLLHVPHLFFFAGIWSFEPFVGDPPFEQRLWSWSRPPFLYPIQKRLWPVQKNQVVN